MAALPPRLSQLPLSASQIQHLTYGNTSLLAHRARQRITQQSKVLFAPPKNIIKPWKSITGGQEWATSTYSYNKNTAKTLPTAQSVTDKLLRDYVTMVEDTGLGHSAKSSAARQATTARRRALDKMYITSSTAKDYGDKIVVNAFVYDAAAGAQRAREKQTADRAKLRQQSAGPGARRRAPGAGNGGAGGARRTGGFGAPRRIGSPSGGSSTGVPRRFGSPSGGSGTGMPQRPGYSASRSTSGSPRKGGSPARNVGSAGSSHAGPSFRSFKPSGATVPSATGPSQSLNPQRSEGGGR